ncbi:MAG: hypothetical protein AB7O60_03220 [Variibacter sp.]
MNSQKAPPPKNETTDDDNPEWTQADFEKAKRFDEEFPDLAARIRSQFKPARKD